ncbi:MAG: class IV adenylate cyclase [Treponema sp.]|nr:class IV adenylate cyclase [Candidatus Treponema equi]
MNEIELKARVEDVNAVEEKLGTFASFKRSVVRDDTYYVNSSGKGRKIRFRLETCDGKETWLVTYKKKENMKSADGISTEVNQEMETAIEDPQPVMTFLEDSGYVVSLKKHKEVRDWVFEDATLELCNVPPLGWFLEIEILAQDNSPDTISKAQKKLRELLIRSGLTEKDIEEKYYSQLLKEYNKK